MQHSTFKQSLVKALTFGTLCLFVFTVTAKAGLDSFEIYLNNKLLLKQSVAKPFNLKSLELDKANSNDQLIIYYSQCNAIDKIGKGRSISVKDGKGKTIKEWKFADAKGSNTGMVILVKELLQLENNHTNGPLNLYYAAEGLPEGQMLASFHAGGKSTTYNDPKRKNTPYYRRHTV